MKKSILFLISFLFLMMALPSNALIIQHVNITGNANYGQIQNNQYNASGGTAHASMTYLVNVSVGWIDAGNLTNVTVWVISGTNISSYTNSTNNGSSNQRIGGLGGDFIVNISTAGFYAEGVYTITAEARNQSDTSLSVTNSSVNSSSITFTIDRTSPAITLNRPTHRSSLSPSESKILFEYTPSDTNLGNCSMFRNGVRNTSSTSGTTSPNVSVGLVNKFSLTYRTDAINENWLVECRDLAGTPTNSSTFTFSALATGASNVVLASGEVVSGTGQEYLVDSKGNTLAVAQPQSIKSKNGTYTWIAVVAVVAVILFFAFMWKPKG